MPAANPLADFATYNTGVTSGMVSGTTQQAGSGLTSGAYSSASPYVGGVANYTVAALVAGSLLTILVFHILGFRFAFDVSVGRR